MSQGFKCDNFAIAPDEGKSYVTDDPSNYVLGMEIESGEVRETRRK